MLETVVLVGHLGLIEEQDNGRHSTVDIRVYFCSDKEIFVTGEVPKSCERIRLER